MYCIYKSNCYYIIFITYLIVVIIKYSTLMSKRFWQIQWFNRCNVEPDCSNKSSQSRHLQTAIKPNVNTICEFPFLLFLYVNTSCECCWNVVPCLNRSLSLHYRPPDNILWSLTPHQCVSSVKGESVLWWCLIYHSEAASVDWQQGHLLALSPHVTSSTRIHFHILKGNQMMSLQTKCCLFLVVGGLGKKTSLSWSLFFTLSLSDTYFLILIWLCG